MAAGLPFPGSLLASRGLGIEVQDRRESCLLPIESSGRRLRYCARPPGCRSGPASTGPAEYDRASVASPSALFVAALCCAPLLAQRTWIVDPTGAGDFLEPFAAFQTAAAGDTIRIRGGRIYPRPPSVPFTFRLGTPLHLVGELPRSGIDQLGVAGLPPDSTMTISGLDFSQLWFENCAGSVALEDVRATYCGFRAVAAAMAQSCWFGGVTDVLYPTLPNWLDCCGIRGGSRVVLNRCTLRGGAPSCGMTRFPYPIPSANALTVADAGTIAELVGCDIRGSDSITYPCFLSPSTIFTSVPSHGLQVWSGAAALTHGTVAGGSNGAVAAVEVIGGSVLHDPSTTFLPPFWTGTVIGLPATDAAGAAPGGSIGCRLEAPPQLPAALLASLGVRAPLALPEGLLWLDPGLLVVLRIGITDSAGQLAATVPVPAGVPAGIALVVQGVVQTGGSTALTAAAPAVALVR